MNESSSRRTVIVGLFVFLGLVFLIAGIFMIGNMNKTFKNKIKIVSHFYDVNGLQTGNDVWFSGVKIGTVSSLDFYGISKVAVSMKIDIKAQQYIRKDARVKISSNGFIGNKILVIYGGTERFAKIQDGDTLEVEKIFSSQDIINTLQDNNKNFKAFTSDFKIISKKLVDGEGTIGKLINDNSIYANINTATESLKIASVKARQLVSSLTTFSSSLNKKGTLVNELTTDTVVFNSVKSSVLQLQQIADTASAFITNLKQTGSNPHTSIGVLLHDEEAGAHLKQTIKNLESCSEKLDKDLEAVKHNFLLRNFFKKNTKTAENHERINN